MTKRYGILGMIMLTSALLVGCGQKDQTTAKTTSSQPTQTKQTATKPKQPVQKQYVHVPALKQVASQRWMSSISTRGLAKVVSQSMRGIEPGVHGPAKWTVAVSSLDGDQQAYVSNWSPAKAQSSASTIKLFILIRYYQALKRGEIHATDRYTLQQSDKVDGSGILLHKRVGTQYTLSQLVKLMINKSDNIATNVLIDKLGGFKAVNATIAKVIGPQHDSSLERKMMDISNIQNGKANRINAWEAMQTLLGIYSGQIIDAKTDQAMLAPMTNTENRTKLPAQLPAGATCWNKSGESNYRGVENDMAIIKYQGHVFAIAALVELDGDGQTPHNATQEQTDSQVAAIARLGANVTNWMVQQ